MVFLWANKKQTKSKETSNKMKMSRNSMKLTFLLDSNSTETSNRKTSQQSSRPSPAYKRVVKLTYYKILSCSIILNFQRTQNFSKSLTCSQLFRQILRRSQIYQLKCPQILIHELVGQSVFLLRGKMSLFQIIQEQLHGVEI